MTDRSFGFESRQSLQQFGIEGLDFERHSFHRVLPIGLYAEYQISAYNATPCLEGRCGRHGRKGEYSLAKSIKNVGRVYARQVRPMGPKMLHQVMGWGIKRSSILWEGRALGRFPYTIKSIVYEDLLNINASVRIGTDGGDH
jgi:hypothetical protein